ncbi:hypothetical protein AG1IA_09351 [Rhizoctonia solani AG-1 IA]|uniref:Uncharacterized protein n=1 Tax=Thanatephorus cucumeris (strain AG1-IA) TaxID=983506 RepID=L8WIP5_THACA|nr:hypothetical protein AG1IA_09351 [Rhizoctonia solani AG-1 IA]
MYLLLSPGDYNLLLDPDHLVGHKRSSSVSEPRPPDAKTAFLRGALANPTSTLMDLHPKLICVWSSCGFCIFGCGCLGKPGRQPDFLYFWCSHWEERRRRALVVVERAGYRVSRVRALHMQLGMIKYVILRYVYSALILHPLHRTRGCLPKDSTCVLEKFSPASELTHLMIIVQLELQSIAVNVRARPPSFR